MDNISLQQVSILHIPQSIFCVQSPNSNNQQKSFHGAVIWRHWTIFFEEWEGQMLYKESRNNSWLQGQIHAAIVKMRILKNWMERNSFPQKYVFWINGQVLKYIVFFLIFKWLLCTNDIVLPEIFQSVKRNFFNWPADFTEKIQKLSNTKHLLLFRRY